jgi:signal transduction histidine kinase
MAKESQSIFSRLWNKRSFGLRQVSKDDCDECIKLLIWSWGHRRGNQYQSMLQKIKKIRVYITRATPNPEDVFAVLDDLERATRELAEFSTPFALESVPVNEVIRSREEGAWRRDEPFSVATLRTELDPREPVVRANYKWLRRAMDNLLQNAAHAITNSMRKEIHVRTLVEGQQAHIIVSDTGKGIKGWEDLIKKPQNLRPNGKGRGLYITQLLVDIWGGELVLEKTSKAGTTIVIRLPLDTEI